MTKQDFMVFNQKTQEIERSDRSPLKVIYYCFPGGKHKVLTASYDDGRPQDRRLVELFNEYGIKATFNINSALTQDGRIPFDEFRELYRGHEVACHTAQHPTIERCPNEMIVQQVIEDRRILEKVMGYPVRGLAYPNGSFDERISSVLKSCGIAYGRTTIASHSFKMPLDFLLWNPTAHHTDPELPKLTEDFVKLYKKQYTYIFYLWGHSYEFDTNNNWNVIEDFCRKAGRRDDIWYATNIQIVDYMRAVRLLEVGVNGDFAYNPSAESVWLSVNDDTMIECRPGEITPLD
ncbi:MAG: polysaccharide deacetylase family protein [Lachnospiraceae bacterium]|jgi:peptidoglycan/xylan/chitin deacetylase (PgdA/CDA1 family)